MLPDRVSNPGPLTYESGALPIALRGPANVQVIVVTAKIQISLCVHSVESQTSFLYYVRGGGRHSAHSALSVKTCT